MSFFLDNGKGGSNSVIMFFRKEKQAVLPSYVSLDNLESVLGPAGSRLRFDLTILSLG